MRAIAPLLASAMSGTTHATTRLADQIPAAATFAARATGALVVPPGGSTSRRCADSSICSPIGRRTGRSW